jgi:hypothetical protein
MARKIANVMIRLWPSLGDAITEAVSRKREDSLRALFTS